MDDTFCDGTFCDKAYETESESNIRVNIRIHQLFLITYVAEVNTFAWLHYLNPNIIGVKYSLIVLGVGGKIGHVLILTSLLVKSIFLNWNFKYLSWQLGSRYQTLL